MISAADIGAALRELGVQTGDTLWVHSGMGRALRVEGRGRDEKLDTIVAGLEAAVEGGTVAMPTFTYSFTEGEDYDPAVSPSTGVGVLPEHFRALEGVRRTTDPLFSAALRGPVDPAWEEALFGVHDTDSFGEQSIFAYLFAVDARFLFFGVPATANTYVHHIEQRLAVPYRYHKEFEGTVHTASGPRTVSAGFYVRDLDADVEVFLAPLGDDLLRGGGAKASVMDGGPSLFVTTAREVARACERGVAANPDYLLRRGHPGADHLYPLLAP